MDIALVGAAFAAGLMSFFSPCFFPLLPVYIGLLTTDASREGVSTLRRMANTVAFVLGICVTFLALGVFAGSLGRLFANKGVALACGAVIVLFGLYLAGFLKISLFDKSRRIDVDKKNSSTPVGAFLLGLGVSFGWTPCIGPILGTVLAMAAQQGTAAAGLLLTVVYSLGMCVPFAAITLASNLLLKRMRQIKRYMPVVQRIGGCLIIGMGLWMILASAQDLMTSNAASVNETSPIAVESEVNDQGQELEPGSWRDVPLEDLDGNVSTAADYVGKPIYFEFFGTWCPQCMKNMTLFGSLANEHNTAGDVQVIAVAFPGLYGEYDKAEFVEWCQSQGYDFPVLMDESGRIAEYLCLGGFPANVLVDSRGNVKLVRSGIIEEGELRGMLAELADM